jgi:hypothetical protein
MKFLLIITLLLQLFFVPQNAFYPAQYIAKLYTEGLARTPDQLGYFGYANYMQAKGCNAFTLQLVGYQILTSAEAKNISYSAEQRILTLYRALLNREPTSVELVDYVNLITTKGLEQTVQTLVKSKEFNNLVPRLCKSKDKERLARYGWNGKPLKLTPVYHAFNGTEDELRRELALYPHGTIFSVAENYYVELTKPLELSGITLQTEGNPKEYAKMARFIRAKNFSGNNACGQPECGEPLIRLKNGASIKNIWIDGNGNNHNYRVWDINVQTVGANNKVENCRIDNTAGFSNIQTLGALEGIPCTNVLIKNNLITGYNSDGFPNNIPAPWVDGITNSCENASIEENSIVDTSDVAIVIFNAPKGFIQNTKVRFNNIFQAGNSTFAGLNSDHIFSEYAADFSGTVFENNLLWTSHFASMRSGISAGSGLWNQNAGGSGFGLQVFRNTTGFGFIKGQYAISIANMHNATIRENSMNYLPYRRCDNIPVGKYVADTQANTDISFIMYNNTLVCR